MSETTSIGSSRESEQEQNDIPVSTHVHGHNSLNKAYNQGDGRATTNGQFLYDNSFCQLDSSKPGISDAGIAMNCTKKSLDVLKTMNLHPVIASAYKASNHYSHAHSPAKSPSVLSRDHEDECSNHNSRSKSELCRHFCKLGIAQHT